MPKQVIDSKTLVDAAYAIAAREGISALSVRKVASACGIAVGSVYVYFQTKADLTAAVLARFFEETFSDSFCAARAGERFTSYVNRFRSTLSAALADMNVDWFTEMRLLPRKEHAALEEVRAPLLAHMERGLTRILEADEAVDRSRLNGSLAPDEIARLTLRTVFASPMEGTQSDTFIALLDAALYGMKAPEE